MILEVLYKVIHRQQQYHISIPSSVCVPSCTIFSFADLDMVQLS